MIVMKSVVLLVDWVGVCQCVCVCVCVEMDVLKLEYEVNRLADILEERKRLVESVGIAVSAKDNGKLEKQLGKVVELLQSLHEEVESLLEDDVSNVNGSVAQYKGLLRSIDDHAGFDLNKYEFHEEFIYKPVMDPIQKNVHNFRDQGSAKKVRFTDNNEEVAFSANTAISEENMHFKPYHDYDDDDNLEPTDPLINSVTNRQLFIEQQQRLFEQDTNIGTLSDSVQRVHGMSLDINNEVTGQNVHVLTDLENMIETSGRNLHRTKRRLDIFQKTARENGPCSIIIILIIILIFLLVIL